MKISVLAAFCLVSIFDANSQEINPSKNSLYFELFGNGGLYSINYERKLSPKFYGRIGLCTFAESDILGDGTGSGTRITCFPVLIAYLSGNRKSHFEIAGGTLLGLETGTGDSNKIIDLTGFIGYRYQPPGGGLIFRIGLTPFLSLDRDTNYPREGYMTSAGISLGFHF